MYSGAIVDGCIFMVHVMIYNVFALFCTMVTRIDSIIISGVILSTMKWLSRVNVVYQRNKNQNNEIHLKNG
jgi:hypothetical protein